MGAGGEKRETRSRTEIEDRKRHQSAGRKTKDRNRGRGPDEWRPGGWKVKNRKREKERSLEEINKLIETSFIHLLPASVCGFSHVCRALKRPFCLISSCGRHQSPPPSAAMTDGRARLMNGRGPAAAPPPGACATK